MHMFFRMYIIELLLFIFETAIVVGTVIMCFVDKGNITSWIQTGMQAAALIPVIIYFVQKMLHKRIIILEGLKLFQEFGYKSIRINTMLNLIAKYQYRFLTKDNLFADDKVDELNVELTKVNGDLFANHYSYRDFKTMANNVSRAMIGIHLGKSEVQKNAREELDRLQTQLVKLNEEIFRYNSSIIQTLNKQKG